MFKNFLSAIVGGDEPTQPPPKSPEPIRPPSQPPSGRSTPMSETGSTFGGGGGRRGSNASSQSQISPVGMGELDLSNLSEAERAQIEAVIARAREMQEEGEQRVRDIEEEFGDSAFKPIAVAPKPAAKPAPTAVPASHQSAARPSSLSSSKPTEPPKTLPKPPASSAVAQAKQQTEQISGQPASKIATSQPPIKFVTPLAPGAITKAQPPGKISQPLVQQQPPPGKVATNKLNNSTLVTTQPPVVGKVPTAQTFHQPIPIPTAQPQPQQKPPARQQKQEQPQKQQPKQQQRQEPQQFVQQQKVKRQHLPQQQQPQIVQVKQEEKTMCPLCTTTELRPDVGSTCSVCETHVCLTCGTFETSPRTRLKEWLCRTCSQERRVMQQQQQQRNQTGDQKQQKPMTISQNGSTSASQQKQPTLKPERQSRTQRKSPEPGQKSQSKPTKQQQQPGSGVQKPKQEPASAQIAAGNIDNKNSQHSKPSAVPEFRQSFPIPRQLSAEGPPQEQQPGREPGRGTHPHQQQQQQHQPQPYSAKTTVKTVEQSEKLEPDVLHGTIKRMPASHQQQQSQPAHQFQPIQQSQPAQHSQSDGHDQRQYVKYPQHPGAVNEQKDRRVGGVGEDHSNNNQRQKQTGHSDINKPRRDVPIPANIHIPQDTPDSQKVGKDVTSPGDKRKSPRPNNLDISSKPKAISPISSSVNSKAIPSEQPHVKQTAEQLHYQHQRQHIVDVHSQRQMPHTAMDIANQPRTVAEGAEAPSKKKPSPLNRSCLNEVPNHDIMDRNQSPSRKSPSRVSPRSPPRSPSWMRYRDSPPRSPKSKKSSPTKSPAERFPSTYSDMPQGEREGTYGEEFQFPDNDSQEVDNIMNQSDNHYADMPPPKPARMNSQYGYNGESYDNMAPNSLDLASYAATVASSTAHLTSMSVSPTNLPPHEAARMSPDNRSLSPPSPNYYDDMEDIDMADPSEKSIDYGNKRQKVKPPPTDWSPITDLSPILDVSPSIEKIEQEKMLAEQLESRGIDSNHQLQDNNRDLQQGQMIRTVPKVNPADQKGLAWNKGYEDGSLSSEVVQRKEGNLKGKTQYSTADDTTISVDRRSRHDGYQQNLPHANSEPVRPTQQTDYPSRQAYSFDSDSRFAPSKHQSAQRDINSDYSHELSNKEYHSHPSFEGDREIDLDLDIPPQKKGANSISEDIPPKRKGINSNSEGVKRDQGHTENQTTFERQGGLVRSKLQIFSKDLITDDNKVKQTEDKSSLSSSKSQQKTEKDKNNEAQSPKYKVLTSPQSPKQEVKLGFDPSKEIRHSELTANKEFMYPSPVTTPEKATSPPRPASPSASVNEVEARCQDRPKHMARSVSLEEHTHTAIHRSSSGEMTSRSQSPGSGSDKEKKNRRKLPTLPQTDKLNQSGNGSMNADKEFLRKRLQEKEAHRSKLKTIKETGNKRPRSAPPCSHKSDVKNGLPKQPPKVAPKPKLPKILGSKDNFTKERPPVPPKPRSRASSTCSTESHEDIVETINIYGIEVPLDVRSMKQRIKEELQIVTATRRLKIDEMEEVRIMERKLADREQQRRLRMEEEARKKAKMKEEEAREREKLTRLENELLRQREIERQLDKERMEAESKALAEKYAKAEKESKNLSISAASKNKYVTPTNASLTLAKMSPQPSPRRTKHRRQNSDPMLAKFSPIEERDIENEMSYRLGIEARKLSSNLSRFSPQPGRRGIRSGSATPPASYNDYGDALMNSSLIGSSGRSKSSEVLTMIDKESMLASSHSETNIPLSMIQRSRTHHFTNEDDTHSKEEKRHQLQIEIEKRRKALEENARLRYEIQKLTEAANISAYDFEEARTKYKQHVVKKNTEYVPSGIIRPLDHDAEVDHHPMVEFSARDYSDYKELMQRSTGKSFPQPSYSSTEYIAHHRSGDRPIKVMQDGVDMYSLQPPDMAAMFRAESDHSMAESDDHVMEGGVTIKQRTDIKKPFRDNIERHYYSFVTKRILLTKDPKDRSVQGRKPVTNKPSIGLGGNGIGMKIVGGKIIPGTEEVGAYVAAIYPGGIADQLHGELQEGDQVLEWNGIPLTGKTYEEVQHIISQPNGEIELVVRPGAKLSCKDQTMSTIRSESCHSSYDNLELTTSDYEEFDGRFIDPRSNMDPDLVASRGRLTNNNNNQSPTPQLPQKPQQQPPPPYSPHQQPPTQHQPPPHHQQPQVSSSSSPHHHHQPANHHQQPLPQQHHHHQSNHPPHRPGQAPPQHHMSPGASPSSSQQDMYLTPSVSMSNSTQSDPNDPPSPTVELPLLGADPENFNRDPHDWGEIQLQLSYDDYDGTLNIHVMQAKGLRAKDRNGLSDPFVKCYLLPGRIGENKRRTKIINRCLDPEWHQTLVFMKISKDDLYSKTLEVAVWDYDRFKPNDFLGIVYLDLGDSAILDNKPHWYKLHEPDDVMAGQLSKPVTYAPSATKQQIIKPPGHSHPIDLHVSSSQSNHHPNQMHHDPHPRAGRMAGSSTSSSGPDQRDLHPPHHPDHHGAKYSPGLGRRKDVLAQRNDKDETVPKKIYLDLKSTNCDDYFCLPPENGIDNMHVLKEFETSPNNNSYENPLLSAFKARHHPSDTTSVSSTSSGVSFDSRIAKSISDVANDNIPVKNIVNNMYSFLGPGQLLTNKRGPSCTAPTGSAFAVTGEILLGLKKSVTTKEIVISVIHCKRVTKRVLVPDAVQDWYVKVYVGQGDNHSRVRKRKTAIQRSEKDPTFHDTFNIPTDLNNLFAEVSLWINRGMFGQNKAIGTTIISFDNIDFEAYKNNELMAYYKFLAPK